LKFRSGHDILAHTVTFSDPNYTTNRVITDLDWSPQINELFLASYSQNEEGSIKDHVGVILLWNPSLKNRAEFYCFCQSAVTSAKFYPFSNSTVLGGCYNGQILLWDLRAKSMPVQRSGISADAHKYPVCSLNVVGTQIANNIVSYSNDGMMCIWDIKQFSKPTRMNKLNANRSQRAQAASKPSALNTTLSANRSMRPDSSMVSNTSSILDRTNKEEVHDINITCCKFPLGDANNYYIGSLNGVLYKNALHNKGNEKIAMLDEHNGPISGISVNNPSEFELLNNLVLTSSYDWTVKLWHPDSKESIRTFENS
jgi:dynein intermediate chain